MNSPTHAKNYPVTDTISLRGILIILQSAGMDNAKEELADYFLMFPDLFEPFKVAFRRMMVDNSCTFSVKAAYLTGFVELSEAEAISHMKEVWKSATGTDWHDDTGSE